MRTPRPRIDRNQFIAMRTVISDPLLTSRISALMRDPNNNDPSSKDIQDQVERILARYFNATAIVSSDRLKPDMILKDSESFLNNFISSISPGEGTGGYQVYGPTTRRGNAQSELKIRRGTEIDPITGRVNTTDTGIGAVAYSRGSQGAAELGEASGVDFDSSLRRTAALRDALTGQRGARLLEAIKNTPDGREFYEKAKVLNITRLITPSKGGPVAETITLITPFNKFRAPPFTAELKNVSKFASGTDSLKVKVALSSQFERNLLAQLRKTTAFLPKGGEFKTFQENFTRNFTTKTVTGRYKNRTGSFTLNEFSIQVPTGGSIPMLNVVVPPIKKRKTKQSNRQSFLSGIQLSALVRARLEQTMSTAGTAFPPMLKNRTGRYIQSVNVFPNYRKSMITYTLNPVYRSLEKYGYIPDGQTIIAIRQVAQAAFSRQFNIVRAN
jgi:hypothetical protein